MVFRYTPEERADIGRYAQLNGVAAAARHYSRKLGIRLSESTQGRIQKKRKEGAELGINLTWCP